MSYSSQCKDLKTLLQFFKISFRQIFSRSSKKHNKFIIFFSISSLTLCFTGLIIISSLSNGFDYEIKKKLINNAVLSRFRLSIKSFKESIKKNDSKKSQELLSRANSLSFKVVNKGIIKKKAASRTISSLARMLKS